MKRLIAVIVLFVALCVPWYSIVDRSASAADVPSEWGLSCIFAWNPVTTYVDGTPCAIAGYTVGIWEVASTAGTPIAKASTVGDVADLQARLLFSSIPSGNGKQIWAAVQAYDLVGNTSAWSDTITGKLRTAAPAKPTGFGCRNVSP